MHQSTTRKGLAAKQARQGYLEQALRDKTREWIEAMVNEELDAALGLGRYQRGEQRRGYRKGVRQRGFATRTGQHRIAMPRAVFFEPGPDGKREWNSQLLPRYARRSEQVEEALIKSYLCGTNLRRIRTALSPLLEGAALSKSTVSRIVARLHQEFRAWRARDLSGEDVAILFLDGFVLKLRLAGRGERAPVLCALGVRTDGTRVLLGLELRTSESEQAWGGFTENLAHRGLKAPVLVVIDGNPGLVRAVKNTWPGVDVQRCTKHKLQNLYTHAPKRVHRELKSDYHAIVYARDETEARGAYERFVRKWQGRCPGVVKSLGEAGEELLTFYRYPRSMWRMLRTTNCIERLQGEFRRRVKTQGSLPNAEAGLTLLYGLFASGQIVLHRVAGWRDLAPLVYRLRAERGLIQPVDNVA